MTKADYKGRHLIELMILEVESLRDLSKGMVAGTARNSLLDTEAGARENIVGMVRF